MQSELQTNWCNDVIGQELWNLSVITISFSCIRHKLLNRFVLLWQFSMLLGCKTRRCNKRTWRSIPTTIERIEQWTSSKPLSLPPYSSPRRSFGKSNFWRPSPSSLPAEPRTTLVNCCRLSPPSLVIPIGARHPERDHQFLRAAFWHWTARSRTNISNSSEQ